MPRATTNRCLRPLIHRSQMSTTPSHLHGPLGFAKARHEGTSYMVENRPYVPTLFVDLKDEASIVKAAKVILSYYHAGDIKADAETKSTDSTYKEKVSIMSGGLTNALFMVQIMNNDATTVLVRVFGAEGMIDRDKETANFARLCNAKGGVVHSQLDCLGRFGNGRVETLIPNMRAATLSDLRENEDLVVEVTRQMARLHYGFGMPEYLLEVDTTVCGGEGRDYCCKPVLWDVLASWNDELIANISQACTKDLRLVDIFVSALFGDTLRLNPIMKEDDDNCKNEAIMLAEIMSLIAQQLTRETRWLQDYISEHHPDAPIAFCHNDINAANILINDGSNVFDKDSVAMIDFEYGASNYAMYDLSNFICEHCGGNDNGIPDYSLMPSLELQRKLVQVYIHERNAMLDSSAKDIDEYKEVLTFLRQVQTFQMVSHFYWGNWGILQGATELLIGTYDVEQVKSRLGGDIDSDGWCVLRYGKNRLARYRELKKMIETETNQE